MTSGGNPLEIYFLGTASGLPTPQRFSQTIAVKLGERLHLLDVADGASSLLCHHELDHCAIRSVVISHMHGDHHSGLIQLIKTMMHLGRRDPLLVYMPQEGIEAYSTMLEACYLLPQWLGFPIEWRAIETGAKAQLDDEVFIEAMANEHLRPFRRRAAALEKLPPAWRFESYSFKLHAQGLVLAYTGNLDVSLLEIDPFGRDADVLITELAHLDLEPSFEALRTLQPKIAIFTHFHPKWDDKERDRLISTQGPQGVEVYLAEDGDIYHIDRRLASDARPAQDGSA